MQMVRSAIVTCLHPFFVAGCLFAGAGSALGDVPAVPAPDAAAEEQAFLRVRPLPEGLETVAPILGAINVRFVACEADWPDGYKANREKIGTEEFRTKSDIYAYLRALQAFEMRDCSCLGKVAAWEGVDAIYASFGAVSDKTLSKLSAEFAGNADRLVRAVETMCGGKF